MAIRAVLFDVGGPIDTEVLSEQLIDRHMREALTAEAIDVSDEAFAEAGRLAVEQFAPDAYGAMIWRLCGRDRVVAERVREQVGKRWDERRQARDGIELRPGIGELIASLHERGLRLGLAANQPLGIIAELDRHGIGRHFAHREVTAHHGYRKPDVRLFLRACEDLGVAPADCVMVGDRIDNDIAPAKLLGMRTVLLRTGRHIAQQPRSADEVPDFEARDVAEMAKAIDVLIARAG